MRSYVYMFKCLSVWCPSWDFMSEQCDHTVHAVKQHHTVFYAQLSVYK